MGYYNMIFQYKENKFLDKCKKSKVDGLIVVDLPYPENKNFAKRKEKTGFCFVVKLTKVQNEQWIFFSSDLNF